MAEDSKKRRTTIARQKLALRDSLWPKLDGNRLRAMPLLLQIMDNLSKGKPVSSTYLDLWCRTIWRTSRARWRWRRQEARGDMIVVRYADDLVVGFEHEDDARRFLDGKRERFEAFSLTLRPG